MRFGSSYRVAKGAFIVHLTIKFLEILMFDFRKLLDADVLSARRWVPMPGSPTSNRDCMRGALPSDMKMMSGFIWGTRVTLTVFLAVGGVSKRSNSASRPEL
jgi:hypothetical protein